MSLINFRNVSKVYKTKTLEYVALDNVNLDIEEGKFVVILGPSGAGKSTMLNLIGALDKPTSGEIIIDNKDISKLNKNEASDFRASTIGFVFQFYNLISTLTVYENVALVKEISKNSLDPDTVLDSLGLLEHKKKFISELSGGEQQRVSIARAIAKNPKILLCDEPTGALDSKTGVKVLETLKDMQVKYNKCVIIVTHNQNIAKIADTVINIKNGKIDSINLNDKPLAISEVDW